VPVDPTVIAALQESVAQAPENFPLRSHLVDLLLTAERWAEAAEQGERLVLQRPDDRAALDRVARAAEGGGDHDRAAAYRRLLAALTGPADATPAPDAPEHPAPQHPAGEPRPTFDHLPPPPVPVRAAAAPSGAVDEGAPGEDEYDAFLREVLGEADGGVERPSITLADVGGMDEVKARMQTSFLGPMRNPELRAMYGTSLRGGLLLYGPPGCGKTYLARAVAGELGAHFLAVGLHDVLDMWLGQSEQNLHALFETARRQAPCVLFLDEVDALGLKRSNLRQSAGRNVVVQLLNELDSTRDDNEGLFVLGATNQPWDLDPALRRPGRFDRMLLVLPPDEAARAAIVEHHLKGRPTAGIDLQAVARRTDGYSGADLRLVCESAAELALEASISSGFPRPIGPGDLKRALRDVRPSTRPWFEVARNYALFANEDGTYDDLLAYMRRNRLG
jgi:AAA+ superfamily predicted ATPase